MIRRCDSCNSEDLKYIVANDGTFFLVCNHCNEHLEEVPVDQIAKVLTDNKMFYIGGIKIPIQNWPR